MLNYSHKEQKGEYLCFINHSKTEIKTKNKTIQNTNFCWGESRKRTAYCILRTHKDRL